MKLRFTHKGWLCCVPIYADMSNKESPYVEGRNLIFQVLLKIAMPVAAKLYDLLAWWMGWPYGSEWEIHITGKINRV
jgi:hypothetical protein